MGVIVVLIVVDQNQDQGSGLILCTCSKMIGHNDKNDYLEFLILYCTDCVMGKGRGGDET